MLSVMAVMYGVAVMVALGALLAACVTDFRMMTIPNILPVLIAVSFVVAYGASLAMPGQGVFAAPWVHLIAFAVMLGVTFLMFAFGLWGAGDSKLAAAIALWIGIKGIIPFLLVMALAGLGLIALNLVFTKTRFAVPGCGPQSWPEKARRGERVLPYGIAIVAGAVAAFAALGYFQIPG